MNAGRRRGGLAIPFAVTALPALVGCRSPTQIDVVVTTDVPCNEVSGTSVTTGTLGEIESIPATTTTTSCTNEYIGSVVLVPSSDESADVGFKVVTGINGTTADQCTPDATGSYGANCIVARRALHYLPHTPLQVDVLMSGQCAGRACDSQSTCVAGACVPATIGNPADCEGNGCNQGVLVPDGGLPDATIAPDASTDAASDAADATLADDASPDATPDAPSDAGAQPDTAVPGCDLRGVLAGAAWPMEDYCPTHRNRSPFLGPQGTKGPSPRWTRWFAGNGTMLGAPAIGPDGTLYVGAGTAVYALEPASGKTLWTYEAPDQNDGGRGTVSMPVLASDGTVRVLDVASGDYSVLPIDGGAPIRVVALSFVGVPSFGRGSMTINGDGTLYASDTDGHLLGFDSTGTVAWSVPNVSSDYIYPSVAADGTVFTAGGVSTFQVNAVSPAGAQRWGDDCGAPPDLSSIAIAPDGTLRLASAGAATLFAFAPDGGGLLWQVAAGSGNTQDVAIADDGTTYVGTSNALTAWGPLGQEAGAYQAAACSQPVIDAAGDVYAVCDDAYLAKFDSTLHMIWSVPVPLVGGQIINDSPVIGPGNTIYVSFDTESADGTNTDAGPPEMLMAFGP